MSEPPKKRRQFLADALFAGGSLAAAAVATRYFLHKDPEPGLAGAFIPGSDPTPQKTPKLEPLPQQPPPLTRDPFNNPMNNPPQMGGAVCPPTPDGK